MRMIRTPIKTKTLVIPIVTVLQALAAAVPMGRISVDKAGVVPVLSLVEVALVVVVSSLVEGPLQ
jgi:hypothetical protein